MRSVLALLAAAAMVAAAFAVRGVLQRSDAATGVAGPADGADEPLALTCVPELAEACETIAAAADVALTVEPAGATADRLAAPSGEQPPDAWLTLSPWPAMVADARERAGLPSVLESGQPLARSPLVIVAVAERAAVLASGCAAATITWRCIGAAAPASWTELGGEAAWGPLKPGHRDAHASASGLLVFADATADYFGRADLSAADLAEPAYRQWVAGLERAVPGFGSATTTPLDQLLLQGPAAYDFVGTTEAEAQDAVAGPRGGGLEMLSPEPVRTADVVLAVPAGERGARASATLDALAPDALAAAGWRRADDPGLPADNGLPSAGLLQALRALWREVT